MPELVTGLIAGASALGGIAQAGAAKSAANAQSKSAQMGIEEQRRQFDLLQGLLQPFVEGGQSAFGQQLALVGVGGPEAQQAAITALEQGPEFSAMVRQGEEAILQNASATGGLRGGNTQAALAQFRPQMLAQQINQQYGRLGGLAQMGQASAAGVGAAGMQTGANVGNLLQQQGAAQAGGALGVGQAFGNFAGNLATYGGAIASGAIPNPFANLGGAATGAPATSIRPMARPF